MKIFFENYYYTCAAFKKQLTCSKHLKANYQRELTHDQVTPFLNRINASQSICSFKPSLIISVKNASIFLCVLVFDGALHKILQMK